MFNKKLKMKLQKWSTLMIMIMFLFFQSCKEKAQTKAAGQSVNIIVENDVFRPIFDGKSLAGWDGDPAHWYVENGNLVGKVTPTTLLKTNTFLIWQGGQPGDFELKLEFRIAEAGNSGINYRSERLDTIPFALRGYQADIDGKNSYTGQNYEERKRATLAYRGGESRYKFTTKCRGARLLRG